MGRRIIVPDRDRVIEKLRHGDREGLGGPEDLAIIGSALEVAERIKDIEKTGIDSFTGSEFGTSDEKLATREVLISLLN